MKILLNMPTHSNLKFCEIMIQDRVAIVIMSGGKDSRIGVPRATLPMFFLAGCCCVEVERNRRSAKSGAWFTKIVWDIRW